MNKARKNIWYMGFTSFFTDVSSEMIFPILPLFLTSVLKANMALVGLIEGFAESTASLLKLASGLWVDKFGKKKPLIVLGYSLSTITKPILALATHWTHVLGVRVADRIGKGIRTAPRDALIAASVNKKDRGKSFGLHRALDSAGAFTGTLVAFLILYFLSNNFRLVFWLSIIPGLFAIIILVFGVRDVKSEAKKKFNLDFRNLSPELKKFLFVMAFFGLANFSYAFFILRASDVGVLVALIPVIYLVYNLFYASFSIPAGRVSDRIGRKKVLTAGFLLFSLVCVGFAFAANKITVWFLFALYGLFMAITDGVSRAYVSDLAAEDKRGTALGAYNMLIGIVVFPANLIGGLLWQKINAQAPFVFAAALTMISCFLLIVFLKRK